MPLVITALSVLALFTIGIIIYQRLPKNSPDGNTISNDGNRKGVALDAIAVTKPHKKASSTEIPSPDKNYCVRLHPLPTPKGEPLRLTFTLFKTQNGGEEAIFNLPETYYCADGIDHIYWDLGSTAITYSVDHFKKIIIHDFIFQVNEEQAVPPDCTQAYWDKGQSKWIIKSPGKIKAFPLSYWRTANFFSFPWKNMQIDLSWRSNKPHLLFDVIFQSAADDFKYAELHDYYVYNPTLITISEDGQARIPVCDELVTTFHCITCDLSLFGKNKCFVINNHDDKDSQISLSLSSLPQKSPYYEVIQHAHGLGLSGLVEYEPIQFIDKKTNKVHFSYHARMESDCQWNKDRTKFFFNGDEDMMDEDYYSDSYSFSSFINSSIFVVLDVKNKCCIKEYKGTAIKPRWNSEGTDALFDNKLELLEAYHARKKEERK